MIYLNILIISNFPELKKDISPSQNGSQSDGLDKKIIQTYHIIVNLNNTTDKEKILKASRENTGKI